MKAPLNIKAINIAMVIHRTTGEIEDLGIVAQQVFTPPSIKDRLKNLLRNK